MPHLKISAISGGRGKQDKLLKAGFDRSVSVLRRPKSPELVVPDSGTSTAQKMRHGTRASSPFDQDLAFSNEYPNVILYTVVSAQSMSTVSKAIKC
jgi:hypothetical protein